MTVNQFFYNTGSSDINYSKLKVMWDLDQFDHINIINFHCNSIIVFVFTQLLNT